MLILTVTVGIVLWAASDQYQTSQLRSIFQENLSLRFKDDAKMHRIRFYNHLNTYNSAVRVYANNISAYEYINSDQWLNNSSSELILHEQVPPWLPRLSVMRSYLWPRYAMLLDHQGNTRELYHYKNPIPADEIINITPHNIELSRDQSHITMYGDQPYVLSSEYINGDEHGPMIVIVSPIDEEMLLASLTKETDGSMVGLIIDGESTILQSSNNKLIPKNTELSLMEERYILTGVEHFDTGSSDMLIKFFSFIPTDEVAHQTDEVIAADRKITTVTAFLFVLVFALVMFWITFRIQRLTHRVVKFSEEMEIPQPELGKADQIDELESRFELFSSAIRNETSALEYQALHDPLTDLSNRKMFNNQLQKELVDNSRHGNSFYHSANRPG